MTYRDWANGIWRQPLGGGAPKRLAGLPEEKLYSYAWSRDGKQFAFMRGAEIRDVVLRWAPEVGGPYTDAARQQYNFSPAGAAR